MVIYHAITYYNILKACIHKLKNHPDSEAVLFVPSTLQRRCSGLLNENKIFRKVYFFTWNTNPPDGNKRKKIKEIDNQLKEWFGSLYEKNIEEINICSAAYYFGIFVTEMKWEYNWFEEADGMLSKFYRLEEVDGRLNPIRFAMAKSLGLYNGDNPVIRKKYIKVSAQEPGCDLTNTENFNVIELLQSLDSSDKNNLLDFFDVPKNLIFTNNSALLLTAHFVNLGMLSYEDHVLIYQLTVDYYLSKYDLFFKWHPTDIMQYPEFMDNVTMISGLFPSELLVLLIKEKLGVCGSIESSGTLNLSPICDKILLFTKEYFSSFRHSHQYYFCMKIMELMPMYNVYTVAMNSIQFKNLLEFNDGKNSEKIAFYDKISNFNELKLNSIILVGADNEATSDDVVALYNKMGEEDILVFLNCEQENLFIPLLNKASPVVKRIVFTTVDNNEFVTELYMYIFIKSDKVKEKIKEMKYVKNLFQTGVVSSVFADTDKDYQIIALKGILEATESKLEKCEEEKKELEKQLMEIKNREIE